MNSTRSFAEQVVNLGQEPFSDDLIGAAECALIDHFAVGFYGSAKPSMKIVTDEWCRSDRGGRVPIYGTSLMASPAVAAMVNGCAVHGFELDDLSEIGGLHPSTIVTSAAVAYAIEVGATGRELLDAIIVGYEVAGRVGESARSGRTPFHTTGTHGPFGSTAAVARLSNFDAESLENAWGLAGSFGGGIKAFQSDGGEVKRLHGGRAAEAGVRAAALSAAGLPGPRNVFDAPRGFLVAFGGAEASAPSIPAELRVLADVYVKPYASAAGNHPAIDMILDARRDIGLDYGDVRSVRIGITTRRVTQSSIPHPLDTMSVQYSTHAGAALALVGDPRNPDEFEIENFAGSAAERALEKIEVVVDERADREFPNGLACRVHLELNDGSIHEWHQDGLRVPRDLDARRSLVTGKFSAFTATTMSPSHQSRLLAAISNLRDASTVDELVAALRRES